MRAIFTRGAYATSMTSVCPSVTLMDCGDRKWKSAHDRLDLSWHLAVCMNDKSDPDHSILWSQIKFNGERRVGYGKMCTGILHFGHNNISCASYAYRPI